MPSPLRCVYTDLDGTLLGRGASLFRDAAGDFTMLPARALEACHRAGAEVVLKSGRRKAQVMEDARLLGQSAFIFEVGCGLEIDGEETLLCEPFEPSEEAGTVHAQVAATGAPALLLDRYAGRLEPHAPWHRDRHFSHLFRGRVDAAEADALLAEHGHDALRLVDNGTVGRAETALALDGPAHAYHLIPRTASKERAVAVHMRARGYAPEGCIAVGDSREDLGVAAIVGRFFLVANALDKDPRIAAAAARYGNVELTEGRNGEGFYEAVVRSLAEAR